jgi:hypothetical protein
MKKMYILSIVLTIAITSPNAHAMKRGNDGALIEQRDAKQQKPSPEEHGKFACAACPGSLLKTQRGLSIHNSRMHEPLMPRPKATCEICKKTFSCAANLKRHAVSHTNQRPFVCGRCGADFADKSSLTRHSANPNCRKQLKQSFSKPQLPVNPEYGQLSAEEQASIEALDYSGARPLRMQNFDAALQQEQPVQHKKRVDRTPKIYSCMLCPQTFKKLRDIAFHVQEHKGADPAVIAAILTQEGTVATKS